VEEGGDPEAFVPQKRDKMIDLIVYIVIVVYLFSTSTSTNSVPPSWLLWILVGAVLFRGIGVYYFLTTKEGHYLMDYPDVPSVVLLLMICQDFFAIESTSKLLVLLVTFMYLKHLQEKLMHGTQRADRWRPETVQ
jgi:ABC-type uncharacterized transport system permease subunit